MGSIFWIWNKGMEIWWLNFDLKLNFRFALAHGNVLEWEYGFKRTASGGN